MLTHDARAKELTRLSALLTKVLYKIREDTVGDYTMDNLPTDAAMQTMADQLGADLFAEALAHISMLSRTDIEMLLSHAICSTVTEKATENSLASFLDKLGNLGKP